MYLDTETRVEDWGIRVRANHMKHAAKSKVYFLEPNARSNFNPQNILLNMEFFGKNKTFLSNLFPRVLCA